MNPLLFSELIFKLRPMRHNFRKAFAPGFQKYIDNTPNILYNIRSVKLNLRLREVMGSGAVILRKA